MYKVIELRGSGIEYNYQTGLSSLSEAHSVMDEMNWRANAEEFLQNGDGNPYNYVVQEDI